MAVTILGISIGTRTIGIAAMRNGELIRYDVKIFKGKWSEKKLETILLAIEALIKHYQVKNVALKAPDPLHSSSNLVALYSHILLRIRKQELAVVEYSLEDLKIFCKVQARSKAGIMDYMVESYPELRRVYLKEVNNSHPYYIKMFEAIAAAKLLAEEIAHV